MQKLLIFKYKKSLDRGFTTLEILISIIIALAFVSVAMQSFVYAMAIKVQAQEKQRANQLIQEDLERTNILASNIVADHDIKCNPAATPTATPPKTAYQNGYAQELWDDVQPAGFTAPTVQLLKTADGTIAGKTLTLTRTDVSGGNPPTIPISSTAPHRTLKINYQVKDPDNNIIAERYVEVIPDVALQCP